MPFCKELPIKQMLNSYYSSLVGNCILDSPLKLIISIVDPTSALILDFTSEYDLYKLNRYKLVKKVRLGNKKVKIESLCSRSVIYPSIHHFMPLLSCRLHLQRKCPCRSSPGPRFVRMFARIPQILTACHPRSHLLLVL